MALTDSAIARLKWRPRLVLLPDRAGLRLAVYPRGAKTWQLRTAIGARPATLRVGAWPEMSVKAARRRAQALRDAIARGEDPRLSRRQVGPVPLSAFARRWIREVVSRRRKNPREVERVLEREVLPALGARPIQKVALADLRRLIFHKRDLGRPAAAIRLRDTLERLFRYGQACGVVEENPLAQLDRRFLGRLRPRTRALNEAELKLFFAGLRRMSGKHAAALELLLLTAARKSELLLARWSHVDLEAKVWEVPPHLSKSGLPHLVYLSPRAVERFQMLALLAPVGSDLRDAYVLPAQSSATQPMAPSVLNKAIRRVAWGMPKFTPHDLRRTVSTLLNEKGYAADVIEKALNHSVRGIRGVYNKAQYAEQRRQMLEEWSQWLEGLRKNEDR